MNNSHLIGPIERKEILELLRVGMVKLKYKGQTLTIEKANEKSKQYKYALVPH